MNTEIYDLGKIGITLGGIYDDKVVYEKLTIVLYKGKSYISTKTTQNISPENPIVWQLVAEAKSAYQMLVDAGKITMSEAEFLEQLEDAVKGRYIIQGNLVNLADEEDLTVEYSDILGVDALKLANRPTTNGMGYIILRQNKSLKEQIENNSNTIFEVKYDFDGENQTITLADNVEFKFDGGSIKNCIFNSTRVTLNGLNIENVSFTDGTVEFASSVIVPTLNTKEFIENILRWKSEESTTSITFCFNSTIPYRWDGRLNINKKNVKLYGGGTIQGHIHLGYDADKYIELDYDKYASTGHHCIEINGLTFNKYNLIGTNSSSTDITNYIANATTENDDNISISLINVNHVKIVNCFFDNVPFPIVYTPNSTYVNQNVRRLNIINCDFERCKIAVYAPTKLYSSIEYGDLMFSHNNIYPIECGLDLCDIDGLKIFNNIINTNAKGNERYNSCNIKLESCSQIVITNNSLYGEYNYHAIIGYNLGNTIIDGNSFASCCTVLPPTTPEAVGLIRIERTDITNVVPGLQITNNLFSNSYNMPIYVTGNIRGCEITGNLRDTNNSLYSNNYYGISGNDSLKIPMYYVSGGTEYNLQPQFSNCDREDRIYSRLRLTAINQYLKGNRLYIDNSRNNFFIYDYKVDKTNNKTNSLGTKFRIAAINPVKPVCVMQVETGVIGNIQLYLNGVYMTIPSVAGDTRQVLLEKIKNKLDNVFGDTYTTEIIGNCIYFVGKSASVPFIAGTQFYEYYKLSADTTIAKKAVTFVYQNYGYQVKMVIDNDIKVTATSTTLNDRLNAIGIDIRDNNKQVLVDDKTLFLKVTKTGNKAKYCFRAGSNAYKENYIYDDTFFAIDDKDGNIDVSESLAAIVNLCYSDRYEVSGLYVIAKTVDIEYDIMVNSYGWYITTNPHCCDIKLVSSEGKEYDLQNKRFKANTIAPTNPYIGETYFDTSLETPQLLVYNGTEWVSVLGLNPSINYVIE